MDLNSGKLEIGPRRVPDEYVNILCNKGLGFAQFNSRFKYELEREEGKHLVPQ